MKIHESATGRPSGNQTGVKKMRLFVPITKVDEEKRLVYGMITQETVDQADEIMDYEGCKPLFEKWSNMINKASGGKSFGNLRAMHSNIAAGILKSILFDDENKAIETCAHVVDDNEWNKCLTGTYTGFSMGGKYIKQWKDPANPTLTRFIAQPVEVSLVDNPCVPSATFTMVKAVGGEVKVEFQKWQPGNKEVMEEATELQKAAGTGAVADYLDAARKSLVEKRAKQSPDLSPEGEALLKQLEAEDGAAPPATPEPKTTPAAVKQVWIDSDGKTHAKKADALKAQEAIDAKVKLSPVEQALANVRKTLGAEAEPATKDDAMKAMVGIMRKHVETHPVDIKTVADGAEPTDAQVFNAIAAFNGPDTVAKGLYTLASISQMLNSFQYEVEGIAYEEEAENDTKSQLPAKSMAILVAMADLVREMALEETAEVIARLGERFRTPVIVQDDVTGMAGAVVEAAARVVDLVKADTALCEKAGARHSKKDMNILQGAHDHMAALGAKCMKDNCGAEEGDGDEKEKPGEEDQAAEDEEELDKSMTPEMKKFIATNPLAKALHEKNQFLEGEVNKAVAGFAELAKDVAELKKQPAPSKIVLKTVDKTADNGTKDTNALDEAVGGDVNKVIDGLSPDQKAELAIRLAQKAPNAGMGSHFLLNRR